MQLKTDHDQSKLFEVKVQVQYMPEQSSPLEFAYHFAYTIQILNHGKRPAQLLRRHWIIKDGFDRVEEVKGSGVVGQQPLIAAGQSFEYTSFCPLPTPTGSMKGTFEMQDSQSGERFTVDIPEFYLLHRASFH